ncbi:MAG TPA: beta-ketoacyl synthase N-terminal-like domain-containing protein, partial [Steroidobacteraceae bacterium]|nr:beta-ketoacyl synthase N-terminal-like domain-containing protein [Steroidobacteraceae bacterium]
MRRVVVTGFGIVSCLGNDPATVSKSLAEGRSGIRAMPHYPAAGLRSHIAGVPQIVVSEHLDRRDLRFMGDAAAFAAIAMARAIASSGLTEAQVSHPRTGLIAGTGGGSPANIVEAADTLRERGLRRVGATRVPRTMCSTVSACLATSFHIKGVCYSLTSACATSAHCIGAAAEQIRWGNQDIMFCGGGEEEHWSLTALFDAMGAL